MGFDSHCVSSPGFCFSTEGSNEWMNKRYPSSNDDDEKIIPKWFCLPYCDEWEKYIEFVENKCSNHRSHRLLVTCNFCQNDYKTINNREVRCSVCCQSIARKLKTYTFEKLKKLANAYVIKRRKQEYIIGDLVQKVESYVS